MNRKTLAVLLSVLYIPPLGILDVVTGSELSLLVLYLVPVAACAWFAGRATALAVGLLALVTWVIAEIAFPTHIDLPESALIIWGGLEKLLVFSALILLVLRIKENLEVERNRAMSDFVTGLPNRLAFMAGMARVMKGGKPFSLVFMELGGLEDLYLDRGETFVEGLLKEIAATCKKILPGFRYSDDRFAAILSEVNGPTAVKRMSGLMETISDDILRNRKLDLRFKIGIAYCEDCSKVSIPHLIRFLAGGMTHLHGKDGDQLEFFQFC
ncbi:MAG: GGDEF domain-containing protein [Spirochaetota bacterium]